MSVMPKLDSTQRWAFVPVLAIGGCTGATTLAGATGSVLKMVMTYESLDAMMPLDVRYGLVNAAGAIAFVVAGAWMAPRYRAVVAAVLYALGTRLAYFVLDPWSFPEHHPRSYQESYVPLVLTLIGGLVGVLISIFAFSRTRAIWPAPLSTDAPETPLRSRSDPPTASGRA
jgi:hypothetical protein